MQTAESQRIIEPIKKVNNLTEINFFFIFGDAELFWRSLPAILRPTLSLSARYQHGARSLWAASKMFGKLWHPLKEIRVSDALGFQVPMAVLMELLAKA